MTDPPGRKSRRAPRRLALCGLLAVGLASGAAAAERWTVATHPAPPFVIAHADGSFSGLAVVLWDAMARDLGVDYELRGYPLEDLWGAVAAAEVELAIGALDVTAAREEQVDFTHPFYSAGLGIASGRRGTPDWLDDARALAGSRVPRILGAAGVLIVLTGLLVWLVERRRNPQHFASGPRGMTDGLWWSVVTMTTVGYGDKAPVTAGGRALAIVWMLVGLVLIASITGAIASALTLSHFDRSIDSPSELAGRRISAVSDSVGADWLDARGLSFRGVDDPSAALDLLSRGEVDAVVHDAVVLRYLASTRFAGAAYLAPISLEREFYAFALPPGSPQRERVSRALIRQVREGSWPGILRLHLGGHADWR